MPYVIKAFDILGSIDSDGTVSAQSLAASVSGRLMPATRQLQNFSYQFWIASGTPTGDFIVEVSNDIRCLNPNLIASARFETVTSVTFTTGLASGSAGCVVVVQNGVLFSRARWVRSAGTGTGFCVASGVEA